MCQKVKKNTEASKHVHKEALLLCLMDLCNEDEDASSSADWVHAVNRGGHCLVSENTAMHFYEIKLLVCKVFQGKNDITTDLRGK